MSNWACFRATSNRSPSTRSRAALAPAPLAMGHSDSRSWALPNGAPASSGMTVTRDGSNGEKLRARTRSPDSAFVLHVTTAASRYRTTRSTFWPCTAQFKASRNRKETRKKRERRGMDPKGNPPQSGNAEDRIHKRRIGHPETEPTGNVGGHIRRVGKGASL